MKILERVNLDDLEFLIIQYCDNDFGENKEFAKNEDILPIMSEDKYNVLVEKHKNNVAYYFGKHSFNFLTWNLTKKKASFFRATNSVNKAENTTEEVDVFLNAIFNSSINLNDVIIIVFEVNGVARNDRLFIDSLNERLISGQTTHQVTASIKAVDLSSILGKDKYFQLDDHMNSLGHYAVAETVTKLIKNDKYVAKYD